MPAFVTPWVQIWWSNWLAQQWDSDDEIPFPNPAALWEKIDDGKPWEPTLTDGYAPEELARGSTGGFGRLAITAALGGDAGEAITDIAMTAADLRTRRAAESAATAAVTAKTRRTEAAATATACTPPIVSPGTPTAPLTAMDFTVGYKQGQWSIK